MKTRLENTIIDLWHISRTALCTQSCTRYDRMQYIKTELLKTYPELIQGMTTKQIWFTIEDLTTVF
jgi:hypothetical protein